MTAMPQQARTKIRHGRKSKVTSKPLADAGLSAARLRREAAARASSPMVPAMPIGHASAAVAQPKSEELLRYEALESSNARLAARVAVLEETIEYLRVHSEWPAEWIASHGATGSDTEVDEPDEVDPESELEASEAQPDEHKPDEQPEAATDPTEGANAATPPADVAE